MSVWRNAHLGLQSRSFQRRADRSRRDRNRLARRTLHLEPFEERTLFAISPFQLISIIPNEGAVINNSDKVTTGPRELVLRFTDGQVIDTSTITNTNIVIQRANFDNTISATDPKVIPGFIGRGDNKNEIIVRFASTLPDDKYSITIGAGLRSEDDAFQGGTARTIGFDLDLGPQITAVVPQPITRNTTTNAITQSVNTIDVYFNNDPLDSLKAKDVTFYQLIRTAGTADNGDDGTPINPLTAEYKDTENKVVLTFQDGVLSGNTTFRLRVGNRDVIPAAPQIIAVPTDPGSSFATARNLSTLFGSGSNVQSVLLSAAIEPQAYALPFPGSDQEPSHRQIPAENHLLGSADTAPGILVIRYNFQDIYGTDPQGNELHNLISEAQKQRAREIFSLYSKYAGVQFVETPAAGLTIVTGDLRALDPAIPTGPGGVAGLADDGLAIMDAAEEWGDSEYGGAWQTVAMHEIGHLLGQGHTYDLPPLTIQGSGENEENPAAGGELVIPGDNDIIHMRHMFRPDSKDIDTYRFNLDRAGTVSFETIAERADNVSLLDSVITVYDSSGAIVGRNDNYFGKDSFLKLDLTAGQYHVIVTSTGNTAYDPNILDSGLGGTTNGTYQLRMNFTPRATDGLADSTGSLFDGDGDGKQGGTYNFWFRTQTAAHTFFVDKASTAVGTPDGSLARPFRNINLALARAQEGDIVRIVGNNFANDNSTSPTRLNDNQTYNIGYDEAFNPLSDGTSLNVPKGVTVMIDEGVIFRMRRANVDVGTSAQGVDRPGGALQVLGTPVNSVTFTSARDTTRGLTPNASFAGDWGGLVFRNDSDREDQGIFLNYVNHARLVHGGGKVGPNPFDITEQEVYNPIHMIEARPSVSFNTILRSADAAMSATPDSFEETEFQNSDYTADYGRVGPDIHGNILENNSINGLFVRITTAVSDARKPLTVSARFDDTDIVHVLTESLDITGDAGGALEETVGNVTGRINARLAIDPGTVVKLGGARIEVETGAVLLAEGTAANRVIFTSLLDDKYGAGGTFDTTNNLSTLGPSAGDWSGFYFAAASFGSFDRAQISFGGGSSGIEGGSAKFQVIEILQSDVRIANSTLEDNADGTDGSGRAGRLSNAFGTIFVRGAQPRILNNIIRRNGAAAININANSLNAESLNDIGRQTGRVELAGNFMTNSGALISGNRLDENGLNGMVVRGGTLTTQSVWDDTDIVHIVRDEIVSADFHTVGGVRLQSSSTASLVVKLAGDSAGFTAAGRPLDLNDRIGGTVQIIGQPGHPVVLTSLEDDTIGAGLKPDGTSLTDTDNNGDATGSTTLPTVPDVPNGLTIDNNVPVDIVGHFELDMTDGGESRNGGLTAQGKTLLFANADFVFDFFNYVDVGSNGDADNLGDTTITEAANLIAPDTVRSRGTLQGQNGVVNWTVVTRILPGEVKATNTITFDSAQPLGSLRFINYLDEDVVGVSDDIMWLSGTPGDPNFLIYTLDGPERVGFAQGGVYTPGPGLVNATWDGWAADQFSDLRSIITGAGTTYSVAGNIDLTDLPSFQDPSLGTVYGPNDVTTAFAWTVDPTATTATITTTLEAVAKDPGIASGAWRGIKLDDYSNDRNVELINESETIFSASGDPNGTPIRAQAIGVLAPNEKSGDDTARLGFDIHGAISQTVRQGAGDVDVYSFQAKQGTEVWLDIDRTNYALDTVVELIDINGSVIARSNDSEAELASGDLITGKSPLHVGIARLMPRSDVDNADFYTTNPRDAGMRVFLPTQSGQPADALVRYYVRVRANSSNLNNLTGGESQGVYNLQIRLRNLDEVAGSTVRYSDIRYAVNGIEVVGKPEHSPITSESSEISGTNDTIATAQNLGNLLTADRNAIAAAGVLSGAGDVDIYKFTVGYDLIQVIGGVSDGIQSWATLFDIDYADGMSRADLTLSVFDENGQLILVSRDSNISDDLPRPTQGLDSKNTAAGSFGKLDPFIGNVQLPAGVGGVLKTYYVAVSSTTRLPQVMTAAYAGPSAGNNLTRLEPVNSVRRIIEDHIEASGGGTATPGAALNLKPSEYHLGDVVLYVNTANGLYTVDPFTGVQETEVTDLANNSALLSAGPLISYGDIAMRNDGRLVSFSKGTTNANSGNYQQIDTGFGTQFLLLGDDGLTPRGIDPATPINVGPPATPNYSQDLNTGVQFDAFTFVQSGPTGRKLYAVGTVAGINNVLIELDPDTGRPRLDLHPLPPNQEFVGVPSNLFAPPIGLNAINSVLVPGSTIFTAPVTGATAATDIFDGQTLIVTGPGGGPVTFEFDTGPDVRLNVPAAGIGNVDGQNFVLSGQTFTFYQGPVIVTNAASPAFDGQIFSVIDATNTTITFEFDANSSFTPGNVPVVFNTNATAAQMAAVIAQSIRTNAAGVTTTATGTRITLQGELGVDGGTTTAFTVQNAVVPANPIRYEEGQSQAVVANAIVAAVQGTVPGVNQSTGGARIFFYGATGPNFTNAPVLQYRAGSTTGVTGTNTAITVQADDTASEVAQNIAARLNAAGIGIQATATGPTVVFGPGGAPISVVAQAPISFVGGGAGGTITGLASLNGVLYAVSSQGGFYRVNNPGGSNATLTAITAFTDGGQAVPFSGLTVGPSNVEGGAYSSTLLATDSNGVIRAFNTTGVLQPIFLDGETSLDTGITGLAGIAFSTLDYNLWHRSTRYDGAAGHGINASFDQDLGRGNVSPNQSFYFGIENPGDETAVDLQPGAGNYATNAAATYNTYNLPGGAYGSLTSDAFSLEGYSANDNPTLYFNYRATTQGKNSTVTDKNDMLDSIRVFASLDDGGKWIELATNNSTLSTTAPPNKFELGTSKTAQGGTYRGDRADQFMQELYEDSLWRQARVDLGDLMVGGQIPKNVRLRFDFSTAGTMNVGNTSTVGDVLRGIAGIEIADGSSFSLQRVIGGAGTTIFEFDKGFSLVAPVGAGTAIADGETFTVTGPGGSRTFEFVKPGGAVNAGNLGISINNTTTAAEVGELIVAALETAAIGVTGHFNEVNRIDLEGATALSRSAAAAMTQLGNAPGGALTNPGAVRVVINGGMSAEEVALQMANAIEDTYTAIDDPDIFTSLKLDGQVLRLIGRRVTDGGPLPFATGAPGLPNGTTLVDPSALVADGFGNFFSRTRGQANQFEGVYIDDVIIGFAERGEMVTGAANNNTTFVAQGVTGAPITAGAYQLEIRRGTEYAVVSDAPPGIVLTATFDPNARFDQALSLIASQGADITEGTYFRVSDGLNSVTFEFDSNAVRQQTGSILITYAVSDTPMQIAAKVAAAINAQTTVKVKALARNKGDAVDLFGAIHVDTITGQLGTGPAVELVRIANPVVLIETLGDENQFRDQGYTIIQSNTITASSQYAIKVGPAPRTSEDNLVRPGSPSNTVKLNTSRLVSGIAIVNNVMAQNGVGGVLFTGDPFNDPGAAMPFGRIINNTIYGDAIATGIGVSVANNASPTIANNIFANLAMGIQKDASSASTVTEHNLFKGNTANGVIGLKDIVLGANDPLFVDAATGNFYLAAGSRAIDSSVNSIEERDLSGGTGIFQVNNPLGIPESPILAPNLDRLGQLRVDDPTATPVGEGSNPFKDRGAIDRADFTGPTAVLVNPLDNDGVLDQNPAVTQIQVGGQILSTFTIQYTDSTGVGIADITANAPGTITITKDGDPLVLIDDYLFNYDASTDTVRLTSATGIWDEGLYVITINNSVHDLADNALRANQTSGATQFTIDLSATSVGASPWQNPRNPFDVNDDGAVEPLDAVIVISELKRTNGGQGGPLPSPAVVPPYYDVTGDGLLTADDALALIDYLKRNHIGQSSASQASSTSQLSKSQSTFSQMTSETSASDTSADDDVAIAAASLPATSASNQSSTLGSAGSATRVVMSAASADKTWANYAADDYTPYDASLQSADDDLSDDESLYDLLATAKV